MNLSRLLFLLQTHVFDLLILHLMFKLVFPNPEVASLGSASSSSFAGNSQIYLKDTDVNRAKRKEAFQKFEM